MSDNKQIIIECIWNNPAPILGGEWKQTRNAWQTPNGTIRLLRTASGNNISVFGNHASGFAGMRYDIFTYIQDKILNTSDFWDTLQSCARVYNVELKLSSEQRERIERARLAREVAPSLVSALMENRTGEAWAYLSDTRGIEPDGTHYGELTADSIKRAKDALKARSLTYSDADFKALGLTDERARNGYNIVLPYFRNGAVVGFIFRNTKGREPKYLYSEGLERGGYCDRLTQGKPAVIVEGQLDALRLMSAGVTNVIAMGGAESGDVLAQLLHAHDIKQITYLPDMEFKEGKQRTDLIDKAIKRFQSLRVDGEPVITQLYVATFPTPQGTLSDYKTDADTYGKEQGTEALRGVVKTAREWWDYELIQLEDWEAGEREAGRYADKVEIERRFMDIYKRCTSPTERERMRLNIDGVELYQNCGITRAALLDVDEWNKRNEYNDRIKAGLSDLSNAVENGANPAKIGDILARMSAAQNTNTRDEWEQQLTASFEDELAAIREQSDTLRTNWKLGDISKEGKFIPYEDIEYYPADITVFCAPTSHGKTMILFKSALDLIKAYKEKTFLFVSCEENQRQLLERALNVYLDIPTNDTGRDNLQNACFVKGARKRSIKAALRGFCPTVYIEKDKKTISLYEENPALWQELRKRIIEGVQRYGDEIRPRLRLVHTEGSAESIAANIRHYVAEYRAQGVEVGGVFVDYMQLLTSDSNNYSRHDELKEICKALKDCAARTELPIIIAAQLNRYAIAEGIDSVTVANIGEGADIERIAHDIYLVWQVDKTKRDLYFEKNKGDNNERFSWRGDRSRRIFTASGMEQAQLKKGYLYIEQMKARDGKTDGWGLFPFDGEQGDIKQIDTDAMKNKE